MQTLKDLMSRDVKVIGPEMSIGEAAAQMRDGDFGMLQVSEDDRMIGSIVALGDFAVDVAQFRPAAAALSEISKPA